MIHLHTHLSVQMETTIRSYNPLTLLDWHWPAALPELGTVCVDWVGSGWVVEGNRQLEMGANVECEELGCVVGGPFKPNKLREVQGLVWRPWINKPSEMTMRCADICHHTALASKHKPPNPSLPPSLLHVLCPTWSLSLHLYPLPCLISSFYFFLTPPSFLCFICFSTPVLPPPLLSPFLHFMSPQWLYPSIRSSMHAWLAVRPGFCMCYRQSYGTALALSRHTTAETPRVQAQRLFIYQGEAVRLLTTAFLLFLS